MPTPSDQPTMLALIDTELQSIQAKLVNQSSTPGATVASHIATLVANLATTQTVMDLINDAGNAGTGLGPTASLQGNPTTLEDWFNAAIVTETP